MLFLPEIPGSQRSFLNSWKLNLPWKSSSSIRRDATVVRGNNWGLHGSFMFKDKWFPRLPFLEDMKVLSHKLRPTNPGPNSVKRRNWRTLSRE
jgi:hypothetical protein